MSRNPCLDAALRTLDDAGVRNVTQAHGGKHLQLRWQVNGHPQRMYSFALTPSDINAPHNVRATIRRMLREDGIQVDQPKSTAAPAPKPSHRLAALEGRVSNLERENRELKALITTLEQKLDNQTAKETT
jgi:hypothetical protein